jgi:hypothetical protein
MWETSELLVSNLVVKTLKGDYTRWKDDVHFTVYLKMTDIVTDLKLKILDLP